MTVRRRGEQARQHPERRAEFADAVDPYARFEDLVAGALDTLPSEVQGLLENVAIVIEDEPTDDQLDRSRVPEGSTLYGLYEGVSPVNYMAEWAMVPNKITIFRLPLEEDYPNPADLAREVQQTVLHELGHHAGLDHAALRRAGFR